MQELTRGPCPRKADWPWGGVKNCALILSLELTSWLRGVKTTVWYWIEHGLPKSGDASHFYDDGLGSVPYRAPTILARTCSNFDL